LKLFAKTLALRIAKHLPHLVHSDQVGFIPEREGRDNTIKALNILQVARSQHRELLLLSTDAEKAFKRVDWLYLEETLTHMGFGPRMRSWVLSLYTSPTARIR
ncbi:-glutamine gamma-glutamyltransferase E-like, partial [Pelobates cultripes]